MRYSAVLLLLFSITIHCFSQTYVLNGNAQSLGGDCYAVTPSINFQNGTIWYSEQINLNNPFDISFFMNFGANDFNGADGMVFVLQQIGVNAIGINGSGMGYQGFNNSFGIEFDTYSNNSDPNTGQNMNDPLFDHVAFLRNGDVNHASANNLAGPVQASSTSQNIEDNQDHIIRITWDPTTSNVSLYFDCILRISQSVNLTGQIFPSSPLVYFGFTGSTGGLNNVQTVCLDTQILAEDQTFNICPGSSLQLFSEGNPAGNFQWSPATYLDDPTSQTPTATPLSDIVYTVTFEDLCGNPSSKQVEIIISEIPTINAGVDVSFCEGNNIQLNGSASAFNTVSWSTNDGNIPAGSNSLTPTIDAGGTYLLEVNYGNNCTISDVVQATEIPLPIIQLPEDFSVCEGEESILNLTNTYDEINWSTGETTSSIVVGGGTFTANVTTNGCSSFDTVVITEIPLPEISLGPDVTICENEFITLQAGTVATWSNGEITESITINQAGTYTASINNDGCIASDEIEVFVDVLLPIALGDDLSICENAEVTLQSLSVGTWSDGSIGDNLLVNAPGTYSIVVENGECISTESIIVTQIDLPNADIGDSITFCNGRMAVLNAFEETADSYLWNTGENTSNIEVYTPGIYSVEVINACGIATDTAFVFIEECDYFLYVPNAFTPNDDGTNDVWHVSAFNIDSIEVFVYNRWGDLIFFTNRFDEPWLGDDMRNGYYVPDGVYNYLITFTAATVESQTQRGMVTILR